jgi:hypothetical protein
MGTPVHEFEHFLGLSVHESAKKGFFTDHLRPHLQMVAFLAEGRMRRMGLNPGEMYGDMWEDPGKALDAIKSVISDMESGLSKKAITQDDRDELAMLAADIVVYLAHFVAHQLEDSAPKLTSVG